MNDPRAWAGYFLVAGALVLVLPLFGELVGAFR